MKEAGGAGGETSRCEATRTGSVPGNDNALAKRV